MNRSEFIRNHPTLSVAEVLERAARDGVTITKQNVYAVRHAERQRSAAPASLVPPKLIAGLAANLLAARSGDRLLAEYAYDVAKRWAPIPGLLRPGSKEERFAELALELGFVRAQTLIANVRAHALEQP